MDVHQECFKTLEKISSNSKYRKGNGKAGVYVWGFSLETKDYSIPTSPDMFFPYYVGKSNTCMYGRTHEHIASLTGGNFSIFDIRTSATLKADIGIIHRNYQKKSKASKPHSAPSLPHLIYPNLLHFPEGAHTLYKFFGKSVYPEVEWMHKHFCITYFVPDVPSKSNIATLEKIIGNIIGYEKLITKPYKKPRMIVKIIHPHKPIELRVYSDLFASCIGKMTAGRYGL